VGTVSTKEKTKTTSKSGLNIKQIKSSLKT